MKNKNKPLFIENLITLIKGKQSKEVGTVGFILALLGMFFCWIPLINWSLWISGVVLSISGCIRTPRGLAIAGLVISLVCLILMIAVFDALASLL